MHALQNQGKRGGLPDFEVIQRPQGPVPCGGRHQRWVLERRLQTEVEKVWPLLQEKEKKQEWWKEVYEEMKNADRRTES